MFLDSILSSGRFPSPLTVVGRDDNASSKTKRRKRRGHKTQRRAKVLIEIGDLAFSNPLPCFGPTILC